MVPHVVDSPKKVDKTAVLRLAAHGLRLDYGTFRFSNMFRLSLKCRFFDKIIYFTVFRKARKLASIKRMNDSLTDAFLRLVDSFLIAVTCRGNIVVVSPTVEQHLGHYMVSFQNEIHYDCYICSGGRQNIQDN